MDFNSAHLLLFFGERREPVVAETFSCKTDQDDLIFELRRVRLSLEDLPGRNMRERVLVTGESDVHRLRTDHLGRANLRFNIRSERQAGGVQGLNCKCGNDAAFAGFGGVHAPADPVEIRIGMNVAQPDSLLIKHVQRLAPQLDSVL